MLNYGFDIDYVKLERNKTIKEFRIDARITDGCNFDCMYCSEDIKKKKNIKYVSFEFLSNFINFVKENINKKITLNYTGGEPMTHPEIEKLISNIDVGYLSINTNFSKNLHLLSKYDEKIGCIYVSYHKPYWKKWESIFKKIEYFKINPNKIILNIMYWPKDQKTCWEIKEFVENKFPIKGILLKRIRTKNLWNENEKYNEDDIKFMFNHSKDINFINDLKLIYKDKQHHVLNVNEMLNKKLWNFKGWKCYSYHEGCLLIPENKIANANCTQEVYDFEQFKNFILSNNVIICRKEKCFCTFDMKFTKEKIL